VKVGVLTAGGDCPGLNAVIRAVTRRCLYGGHEVVGLLRGYHGLAERSYLPLNMRSVSGILPLGGTILSTSSYDPFREPNGVERVRETIAEDDFAAVVAIGGEHTMSITRDLHERHDLPLVGVPKTIDNDVPRTDFTFGFDTAVQSGLQRHRRRSGRDPDPRARANGRGDMRGDQYAARARQGLLDRGRSRRRRAGVRVGREATGARVE
jgi:6-phosphofructokinase